MSENPNLVMCTICGEFFDPDDGSGVQSVFDTWTHESCQDAQDEADQNAPDLDPVDFEYDS